jgi:superfamily I DNA/RNA helicase
VAHNGQSFDVPVLRRLAAGLEGLDALVFYDTLPLARALSPDSAKLGDLAARLGIATGRAHHALDDAIALAHVFRALAAQRLVRARKAVLLNLLDYLGLALALDRHGTPGDEGRLLLDVARFYALGRFSGCLEFYAAERERTGAPSPSVDEVIERLGGKELMARLRAEPDPAQRYPAAVARLGSLMAGGGEETLDQEIARLLERVALTTSEGADVAPGRVNLLTLHSTKGLEFSRVYVVGVEDHQVPGYYAVVEHREDEIQESRRLLYVGMTRARDRLILTRADRRRGLDGGGSQLLDEMGLEADRPVGEPRARGVLSPGS